MSIRRKRRVINSKRKSCKRLKSTWLDDVEKLTAPSQSHEMVKLDPNKRSSSTRPDTKGPRLNLQQRYIQPRSTSGHTKIPFSRPTGSHTIDKAAFVGCDSITLGNTAAGDDSGNSHPTNMSRHTYNDILVAHSRALHVGNTGNTVGKGHKIKGMVVRKAVGVHIGNFSTTDVKYRNFQECQRIFAQKSRL